MNYLLRDPNVRLCLKSEYNNKNFKKIYIQKKADQNKHVFFSFVYFMFVS